MSIDQQIDTIHNDFKRLQADGLKIQTFLDFWIFGFL
jgi:hypothetical protein